MMKLCHSSQPGNDTPNQIKSVMIGFEGVGSASLRDYGSSLG